MKITNIKVNNFHCYDEVTFELHPSFNVLVGINGTGKTSLLEAMRIAVGSLFYGFDKIERRIACPSIQTDDVRLENKESQYPSVVNATFSIDKNEPVTLTRALEKYNGKTKFVGSTAFKVYSEQLQRDVRSGSAVLPLIAYYSVRRYKKDGNKVDISPEGSRLRGYYNILDTETNVKSFLDAIKTETLWELQHSSKSSLLCAIKEAVRVCVPECESIEYDIRKDKIYIKQIHDGIVPFHMLSDGVRSMLGLVVELACRCYLLNPMYEELAAMKTKGIVMIDEIDLHLHPEWQKHIVADLHAAFPNIQFIVTTHSPLVLGGMKEGEIFNIADKKVFMFPNQYGMDANATLVSMGTTAQNNEVGDLVSKYSLMIEEGLGSSDEAVSIRENLVALIGENHPQMQQLDTMFHLYN